MIVLTDNQRLAWRPGETARWALLRELHRRLPVPPAIWSVSLAPEKANEPLPNASVGPLNPSRRVLTPGLPFVVTTSVENAGPGPATRSAELLIDGRPSAAAAQPVGPVAPGGRAAVSFHATIASPGSHVLSVRLDGLDALAVDDVSSLPVEVVAALPVLLVDGAPGTQPFQGATDFLRAALAPTGDDAPQVRTQIIAPDRLSAESARTARVVILAGIERLTTTQASAAGSFAEAGGGLLIVPGHALDARSWNAPGWMPATFGDRVGDPADRRAVAHPAPRTFTGPLMAPFAQGDDPPLGQADFFSYRRLTAAPGAAVAARLDTGDPWLVERSAGRGRVALLAAPLDAQAGTLPVNPDFVPLVHELIASLAGSGPATVVAAGEPLSFPLPEAPPPDVKTLPVETPGGGLAPASVISGDGTDRAERPLIARLDDATEAGVYRLRLPGSSGSSVYGMVRGDPRESDMTPLDPAESAQLAQGWPFTFTDGPDRLEVSLAAAAPAGNQEIWRLPDPCRPGLPLRRGLPHPPDRPQAGPIGLTYLTVALHRRAREGLQWIGPAAATGTIEHQLAGRGSLGSCSTTSKTYPSGSRKKNRWNGVSRIGSISVAPRATSRCLSAENSASGKATAMCRPYSRSKGEGANSGSSTRCSSTPGVIDSQAAARPMLPGRVIGRQPSASAKNADARATSRVASVMWATDIGGSSAGRTADAGP